MFEEFGGNVFVSWPGLREFEGNRKHGETERSHPRGAIGLVEFSSAWKAVRAIEDSDVVEAQKSPAEDVSSFVVLAVDPPGEVEKKFLEGSFEKEEIA